MEKQINSITYKDFYDCLINYIQVTKPSNKDTTEFLGAIIHSIFETIEMDSREKIFYLEIYNKLIKKKLSNTEETLQLAN